MLNIDVCAAAKHKIILSWRETAVCQKFIVQQFAKWLLIKKLTKQCEPCSSEPIMISQERILAWKVGG